MSVGDNGDFGSKHKRRAASNGFPNQLDLLASGSGDDRGGGWTPPRVASSSGYGDGDSELMTTSSYASSSNIFGGGGSTFSGGVGGGGCFARPPLSRSLESLAVAATATTTLMDGGVYAAPTAAFDPLLLAYAPINAAIAFPAAMATSAAAVAQSVAQPHADDSRVNYSFDYDSGVASVRPPRARRLLTIDEFRFAV